jgi:hypothetical protein
MNAQPISLTDDELTIIMTAVAQLQPQDREQFLRQVAQVVGALPARGPGSFYRVVTAIWRQHYDAPIEGK